MQAMPDDKTIQGMKNAPQASVNPNFQPDHQSPYPDPKGPDFNPSLSKSVVDNPNTANDPKPPVGNSKGSGKPTPSGAGSSCVSMVVHACVFLLAVAMGY